MKAWLDGAVVDAAAPAVALDDPGLLTGHACFETMKVRDGAPFALDRHLRRLARSCEALGLPVPDGDRVRAGCAAVVAANGSAVGRLRVTVTAGGVLAVTGAGPRELTPTAAVCVCPWVRNERSAVAGVKSTSYAENVVAAAWAAERGCTEALFANTKGELCEGTGSNVFVVLDGRLVTPPLSSGCLAGVTRELLVELLDAEEAAVPVEALAAVEEAFLASSTRDVQPVHALDGRPLVAPGPVTAAAIDAWDALVARTLDP